MLEGEESEAVGPSDDIGPDVDVPMDVSLSDSNPDNSDWKESRSEVVSDISTDSKRYL